MLTTILAWYTLFFMIVSALLTVADSGKPKTASSPKDRLLTVLLIIPMIAFPILYLLG